MIFSLLNTLILYSSHTTNPSLWLLSDYWGVVLTVQVYSAVQLYLLPIIYCVRTVQIVHIFEPHKDSSGLFYIVNCKMHVNCCAALFQKGCQGKRHYFTISFSFRGLYFYSIECVKGLWNFVSDLNSHKNIMICGFNPQETMGFCKKFELNILLYCQN